MTYYETPGVLLDVAYTMIFYFNEDYVINKQSLKYNEANSLEYYFQFKESFRKLKYELHPFAYSDDKISAIVSDIVYKRSCASLTLDKFIDYLESNEFKLKVYNHWFENYEFEKIDDLKNVDIINNIKELLVPEQMKFKLIVFFNDFEKYRDELIKIFTKLYQSVSDFRSRHKNVIEFCMKQFDNTNCYNKLTTMYNIDISEFNYTITLINSVHLYTNDSQMYIVFGVKAYDYIRPVKNITIESFAMAYSDETRAKIVDYIARYQPICISDLRNILNIKHSTLYHHLNILYEEGILIISKNSNNKFDYKINVEYYEKIGKLPLKHKRSNSKKMKRNIDFNYIIIDSNKLLTFNPESGDTFFLNETAAIVLKLLEQYPNVEDLIMAVSKEYDEDPAIIKADVHQTIAELVEKRVLVEVN